MRRENEHQTFYDIGQQYIRHLVTKLQIQTQCITYLNMTNKGHLNLVISVCIQFIRISNGVRITILQYAVLKIYIKTTWTEQKR